MTKDKQQTIFLSSNLYNFILFFIFILLKQHMGINCNIKTIYMGANYSFKLRILYLVFRFICASAFLVVHKPTISLKSKSPSTRVQFFYIFFSPRHAY